MQANVWQSLWLAFASGGGFRETRFQGESRECIGEIRLRAQRNAKERAAVSLRKLKASFIDIGPFSRQPNYLIRSLLEVQPENWRWFKFHSARIPWRRARGEICRWDFVRTSTPACRWVTGDFISPSSDTLLLPATRKLPRCVSGLPTLNKFAAFAVRQSAASVARISARFRLWLSTYCPEIAFLLMN